jgi:NADH-quinone oxidoreductase subunit E
MPPSERISTPSAAESLARASAVEVDGPGADAERAVELSQELARTQSELSRQRSEVARLAAEREGMRARLEREGARVRELEAALKRESELRTQAAAENARHRAELEARIRSLEEERAALAARGPERAERATASETGKPRHDLRAIRGIGPAAERVLREHGIESVAQIAAWSDADLPSIAEKLKLRADRIRREDWVGQAKAMVAHASSSPA